MCTAIAAKTAEGDFLLGRTMDFSYPLDPELFVAAPGYAWPSLTGTQMLQSRFRFMGIGQDISPVVFSDGVNERGFAAAMLYFPGYAAYDAPSQEEGILQVAAAELVGYLLGQCATVAQAVSLLRSIRIVGAEDPVTRSVAPLHWLLADAGGHCMAAEKMTDGLHIIPNPLGVLSNSPNFPWHMTNLRNYLQVAPAQSSEANWGPVHLEPFGQGGGTFGLPGDFTPPSRFVRAAYLKTHTEFPPGRDGAVRACFHVMESLSIPKGAVVTSRDTSDYTQYTAFYSLQAQECYFRTYDNSQITMAAMADAPGAFRGIRSLGKLPQTGAFARLV